MSANHSFIASSLPGDFGCDPARRRVFVPLLGANQVMVWTIP
ncbi:MAG TPA: hypothetical protein VFD64_09410 [Gemmatimonadaceae bacterium]|nr:hypothetical protein [Gemmatimonadaceae bacterium]